MGTNSPFFSLYNLVMALITVAMMSLTVILVVEYRLNPLITGFFILILAAIILSLVDPILRKESPGARRLFKDLLLNYFDLYLIFIYAAVISSLPNHSILVEFSTLLVVLFVTVNLVPIIFDKIGQGRDPPDDLKRVFEDLKGKMEIRKNIRLRLFRSSLMKTALLGGIVQPTVFINEDLLKVLSNGEIKSVLAHELAHYKEGDIARYLGYTLLMYAMLLLVGEVPSSLTGAVTKRDPVIFLLVVAGFLAALSVFLILIRRREVKADLIAASYSNPEDLINALIKIYGMKETPSLLPTHPSLEKRIEIIRRMSHGRDETRPKGG